jgi:hypothetical protein
MSEDAFGTGKETHVNNDLRRTDRLIHRQCPKKPDRPESPAAVTATVRQPENPATLPASEALQELRVCGEADGTPSLLIRREEKSTDQAASRQTGISPCRLPPRPSVGRKAVPFCPIKRAEPARACGGPAGKLKRGVLATGTGRQGKRAEARLIICTIRA